MKKSDKRGIEISISLIILIVLGVIVLIGLLILINSQTGFFTDILDNFRGKSNVDAVVLACNNAVDSEGFYTYCCEKREVVLNKKEKYELTCDELREEGFGRGVEVLDCEGVGCS
jgi:hypothetical protein